jgi:hypothetical protein
MNLENMTVEELTALIKEAEEKKKELIRKGQQEAWEEVKKAISNYINLYGEINIEYESYEYDVHTTIDDIKSFSDVGEIYC